jgi:signal transduction histidine kinase
MTRIHRYYKRPLLLGLLTAGLVLVLTQVLVYAQYKLSAVKRTERLTRELNIVEDRFKGILLSDITAANTLAIIYKRYGFKSDFDSVAKDIMLRNKYVEALQITEDGTIKYVYPLTGYENTIGVNAQSDPTRMREARNALERNEIYFAGPRRLRQGGTGILGKVPIIIDGKLKGLAVVLTRLPTIVDALNLGDSSRNQFAYQLKKLHLESDTATFLLSANGPAKNSEVAAKVIPEGGWILSVSYSQDETFNYALLILSLLGILLSWVGGVFTYRRLAEPIRLQQIIEEKTEDLTESLRKLDQLNADLEKRVQQRTEEVNKLNEDLKLNIHDLKIANTDLESFNYSVSHDLRAPLRAINGYVSLLMGNTNALDERGKTLLDNVLLNAKKMDRLIEELLAFARAGKKELEKTDLNMNELLHDVQGSINFYEWNASTQLIAGDMLPAYGDAVLIKQVLFNLISNAVKYSRGKEKPIIEVGSYASGNENTYFVKDNGAGFDMRYANKLFKVFQRMHSAAEFEGTGVGLAIVQRIVMKHKGRVWAEAKEAEGAAFFFTLPRSG